MRKSYTLTFILFISVIATFHYGYRFGLGDQEAGLAQILHMQDETIYANDIVIDPADQYGLRFFSYYPIAIISKIIPLELVCLLGVLLTNFITALITFWISSKLFPGYSWLPYIAVGLICTVNYNPIDDYGMISNSFVPRQMSFPLAIGIISLALLNRPVFAGCLAAFGTMIHPLMINNAVIIAFAGMGFHNLILLLRSHNRSKRQLFEWLRLLIGGLIYVAVTWLLWVFLLPTGSIDEQVLFDTLLYRSPARYLPIENYGLNSIVYFAVYLLAIAVSLYWWRHDRRVSEKSNRFSNISLGMYLSIWGLFIGSIVFVQLIPSLFWLKLEPLNAVLLGHWFGLVLLSYSITRLIELGSEKNFEPWKNAAIMIVGTENAQPLLMLYGHLRQTFSFLLDRLKSNLTRFSLLLFDFFLVTVIILRYGDIETHYGNMRFTLSILIFMGISFGFIIFQNTMKFALITTLSLIILLIPSVTIYGNTGFLHPHTMFFSSIFSLKDAHNIGKNRDDYSLIDDISLWVKEHTSPDVILLTPPMESRFRLVSQRSVVIGFKVIITTPDGLPKWLERMETCYGKSTNRGFAAVKDLDKNYHDITERKLSEVHDNYGADYAIVYKATKNISMPVVYENNKYKLVVLR